MKKKVSLFILTLCLSSALLLAQDEMPVNSNYLIEHGVSPRVLDAAASLFMQDGRFTNNVLITTESNGAINKFNIDLIFDPAYKDGMDIRVVNKSDSLSKKEKKELKKYIETSHYFSRMSRRYLYDESTLKMIKNEGEIVVLEFYYQKNDIEPYLRNIKRLKGEIYLVNGKLDKVVLVNTEPLKNHITKFKRTLKYAKVNEGGYIITSISEEATSEKGGKVKKYKVSSQTLNYTNDKGKELTWENKPEARNQQFVKADTIIVKLGGPLPLLGKSATKLGYKLPRPIGVAGFVYTHDQFMQFTGLQVGIDANDMKNLGNLLVLDESDVSQTTYMTLAKADVWIFPFLNIMAIVGGGKNNLDGELVINKELRDFINGLPGWIFDIPNIPKSIPIKTSVTSEVYGGGATLAGGFGDFNATFNYQFMMTKIIEANTINKVHIITPMLGYMAPFKVNFMLGAQGQFYNTKISGFIEMQDKDGNMHKLDYNVDFEPIKWNAIVGLYKGFNKHWEMSIQAGFGQRTSLTAIFGYRF